MADKKDNQNSGQMSMFDINGSLTQNASEVADVAQNKTVTKSTVRGVKIDENNLPEGTRIVIKPDGRKVLVRKKVVPKDQGQIATATTAEKAAVKSAPAKASAKPVVEEKRLTMRLLRLLKLGLIKMKSRQLKRLRANVRRRLNLLPIQRLSQIRQTKTKRLRRIRQ